MARKRKYEYPIQLIALEEDNYHILLDSIFENGENGKWTIDTGASKTVFDLNLTQHFTFTNSIHTDVQSAGIGDSQIETQSGNLSVFRIGDFKTDMLSVALIDLQHVNKLYAQFSDEKIVGLLGSDFLLKYQAQIDYKNLRIKLYG